MVDFKAFEKLDIRVGRVKKVKDFPEARKSAYRLWIDFGEIGVKQSSAQITDLYEKEQLENRLVIGIVNFDPLSIAGFKSEVLVLGVYADSGVSLLKPDHEVEPGSKIG